MPSQDTPEFLAPRGHLEAANLNTFLAFNVDTINIAQTVWRAPTEQVAAAQAAATAAGKNVDAVDTSISALRGLALPVGWTAAHQDPVNGRSQISSDPRHAPATVGQWLLKALGSALTTLTVQPTSGRSYVQRTGQIWLSDRQLPVRFGS